MILKFLRLLFQNKIIVFGGLAIVIIIISHENKVLASDFCDQGGGYEIYKIESVEQKSLDVLDMRVSRREEDLLYLLSVSIEGSDQLLIQGQEYRIDFHSKKPENFDGFNYKDYLLGKEICYVGNVTLSDMELVKETSLLTRLWSTYESHIHYSVSSNLPRELTGLFFGLILGKDMFFTDKMMVNFQELGLTHLIAVSGANFILIVSIFSRLITFERGIFNKLFQVFIASVFMLLVGGTNLAAFRAYVFLLVSNTLKLLGVRLSKLSKFVLGVLLILVFIPHAYADIGFQLSVISWSLLNLIPAGRLISKFSIIPEIARDEVLMAFFGSFILFPVSLLYFKEYNLASLVANTIVGPLFSILSLVLMGIFPVSLISSGYFVEKLINLVNSGVVLIYRLIGDFSGLEFVVKDGDFVSGIIYIVFFGVTSYFIYKGIYKYASKECIQDFYI